ncbi:hypothetical protein VNI00_018996 [Paramarasmius palmivorus]|uniref:Transposase family Tnp2 protein n=1 Tax=Paramarasmius palmivorus TaxID=297713 RepID=A0AAW0ATI0_9AGAR
MSPEELENMQSRRRSRKKRARTVRSYTPEEPPHLEQHHHFDYDPPDIFLSAGSPDGRFDDDHSSEGEDGPAHIDGDASSDNSSDGEGYGEDTPLPNEFTQEHLPEIFEMIEYIKNYDMDEEKKQWTEEQWDNFLNPSQELLDLDSNPDLRLSIEIYLSLSHASEETYARVRQAVQKRYPDSKILSYDQVRRRLQTITGIIPLRFDKCINTCLGYLGPFADLEDCPICGEARYDEKSKPKSQFVSVPVGPQLQALWRHPDMVQRIRSRVERTEGILEQQASEEGIQDYSDILHGTDYLTRVESGEIDEETMLLLYSEDSGQLYRDKDSSTLFGIAILGDVEPELRHLEEMVMPLFVVGGPETPQIHDSFILHTVAHIAACQRRGIRVWDSLLDKLVKIYPWLLFALADTVAMAELSKSVGHHGRNGCRLLCLMQGRHKPGVGMYYPALFRPPGPVPAGTAHDNIEVDDIDLPTVDEYQTRLNQVLNSTSNSDYEKNRKKTGIRGPSLFSALPLALPVPHCFPADFMHLFYNLGQLLVPLWRGSIEHAPYDDPKDWDFAILYDVNQWKSFGNAVEQASRFLPTCLADRIPRNPAKKINTGYKASEYLVLVFDLCPALFYGRLPSHLYEHFCLLVSATRTVHRRRKTREELLDAHAKLTEFVVLFELYYYELKMERLHFVRPCIHALLHVVPEHFRVGSLTEVSQWTMERTIGNYERRIRLHSDPYGNLGREIVEQAMSNALCAMDPSFLPFVRKVKTTSKLALDVGSGYSLLHPREHHPMDPEVYAAFVDFCLAQKWKVQDNEEGTINVYRYARLQLPSKQIVRSLWQEGKRSKEKVRRARNVKLILDGQEYYAEVLYFFRVQKHNRFFSLAAVIMYSVPDPEILADSHDVLRVCTYLGEEGVAIVDAKSIIDVVGMVPFRRAEVSWDEEPVTDEYFVIEKLCSGAGRIEDEDEDEED